MSKKEEYINYLNNVLNSIIESINEQPNRLKLTIYENFYSEQNCYVYKNKSENIPISLEFVSDNEEYDPEELRGKTTSVTDWTYQQNTNTVIYTRQFSINGVNTPLLKEVIHNKTNGKLIEYSETINQVNYEVNSKSSFRISHAKDYAEQKYTGTISQSEQTWKNNLLNPEYSGNIGACTNKLISVVETIYDLYDQLEDCKLKLQQAQEPDFNPPSIDVEPEPHVEVEEQGDHIYPVTLVCETTNKMIDFNNQLSTFIQDINGYEQMIKDANKKGIAKINLDYVARIAEKFCKRINYWLAMLRYYLIKGLSGIFNSVKKFTEPISNLVDAVTGLSVDSLGKFASSFLKIISGPYAKLVEFVQDNLTHTPPLISQCNKLVKNTSITASKATSLYSEIKEQVDEVLNTDYLDPEVVKRLAEKYTNITDDKYDYKIKFIPISMDDIINAGDIEKPVWKG